MHSFWYISTALIAWLFWVSFAFLRNYKAARSTQLPIVLSPTGLLNPFWIVSYKLFPFLIPLLRALPFNLGKWAGYTYMGWQFDDKYGIHKELGPAFVICTPGINEVIIADPSAIHNILTKRKDFIKPSIMYDGLNAFGRNLDSVEGEVWQRHRKITAPNFNEKVSASVWTESVSQARQMLHEWISKGETRDVVEDTASATLNIFTYAGFGVKYAFRDAKSKIPHPHKLTYRDALYYVLRSFTLVVMLPQRLLKSPFMPTSVRKVGEACDEFRLYMKEMVEKEKASIALGTYREASNLLGALVQASQAEKHGLTDEELYGNLFIYNMAGHESTANTVATCIAYLASAPQWQDWLSEEIHAVSKGPVEDWSYETVFPKLIRCQAAMLETLRLHGSTVFLPKSTPDESRAITINGREHLIPPKTFITTNSQAVHCDPDIWGDDSLEWRPDRWLVASGEPGGEHLLECRPGAFVGWAEGPRICPGKKFSQVEFAGVMAVLFRDHTVAPKSQESESVEKTRKRLTKMIEDSAITAITLQMRNPQDVALVWKKRN